jgi:hypothetical protein
MKSKVKNYPLEKISIAFVFAAGILLSLLQFLYNRNLWMDEAMLALNIIRRNSLELLQPLDYDQVAPILFLQIEKIFSTLLPNTEYGLRIFPLLCFWASMYFFYKIIRIRLHNIYAVILALSLFAFNSRLLYYSSEIKQYMSDVLVLLFLFYTLLRGYKKEKNRLYVLGVAGIIAIFLSNVAPIILFTCGLYLLYNDFFITRKRRILSLTLVFAGWLTAFVIYYYFFIYEHPTREFMIYHWSGLRDPNIHGFLPHNSLSDFYFFLYNNFVTMHFMLHLGTIMIIFSIVGTVSLIWRKKVQMAILVCTPVLLHLFLSTFQLYPFSPRLILYIFPCVILICSIGFECLTAVIFTDLKIKRFRLFAIIVPMMFLYPFSEFPVRRHETKKSLKYIEENIREGESVYIQRFDRYTYYYYQDIGFVHIKAPMIEGYDSPEENFKILKKLHGKTWLLLEPIEKGLIINRFDSLGYRSIKEFHYHDSSVYLYDFGQSPEADLE